MAISPGNTDIVASKIRTASANVEKVYYSGVQNGQDEFWKLYQQEGTMTNYSNAFSGPGWTRETFMPRYDIKNITNAYMLFYQSEIKGDLVEILDNLGIVLDVDYRTATYAFSKTHFTRLGEINLSNTKGGSKCMFSESLFLTKIDKLIFSEVTNLNDDTFRQTPALEDITIEGSVACNLDFQWSPLSRTSIESIVGHLSGDASGKTLTLSKSAVTSAFGGEWDTYVNANKPSGWNITLV